MVIIVKQCSRCKEHKQLASFSFLSKGLFSRGCYCRSCAFAKKSEWYEKHQKDVSEYNKTYKAKPEYKTRRSKLRAERRKTDESYRIADNYRRRINLALKGVGVKIGSTTKLLGCSIDKLKEHLEAQFEPWMTWENYGIKGWHIDHIRPCSSFDLTKEKEQRKCFHYTNLAPLLWKDNISKGSTWTP